MSLKSSILKELALAPMTEKQLKVRLHADGKKLSKNLNNLYQQRKIEINNGFYSLPLEKEGIKGTLVKLGGSFGFVSPADETEDIFIPGSLLKGAMPGDEVIVVLFEKPRVPGSREGEVIAINKRADKFVGTVEKNNGKLYLVPDKAHDTPLHIRKSADGGAKPGEVVAGEIIERGISHNEHDVGIVARFGFADSARQCSKAILYASGIEKPFPEKVKSEAKEVAAKKILDSDIKERMDLRNDCIFTIDSRHTKDMDDAVSAKKLPNGGYSLGVHIADVSYYVKPHSLLDKEALARGNSIYYADNVIAMLPKSLSNGICSLNPNEDRLSFSCIIELDNEGGINSYKFAKTVINSCLKGEYEEINEIFNGSAEEETVLKYSNVSESLNIMNEIYKKLDKKRKQRGSIEIEDAEALMKIDKSGKCIDVQKRHRGDAEKLIEEFMLLANTCAAMYAKEKDIPFIYRVHEKPPVDKIDNLKAQLSSLGINFEIKGEIPSHSEYAELLNLTRGTNLEYPVHSAVLRSMSKAKYENTAKGHFGLSLKDYAHFTSPIRRYSDLAIHRVLSDVVSGNDVNEIKKRYENFTIKAASSATERELISVKAERDCDDCYKAEYMKQFIGDSFEGVISSVMPFGVYVTLPNTIEGLIHVSRLSNKSLDIINGGVALKENGGNKKWQIGDEIKVKLINVSIAQGNIDFELA